MGTSQFLQCNWTPLAGGSCNHCIVSASQHDQIRPAPVACKNAGRSPSLRPASQVGEGCIATISEVLDGDCMRALEALRIRRIHAHADGMEA